MWLPQLEVVCLLAFLSSKSEIHPVLREKVACGIVSQQLYVLSYITHHSDSCTLSPGISTVEFAMSGRLLQLTVVMTLDS